MCDSHEPHDKLAQMVDPHASDVEEAEPEPAATLTEDIGDLLNKSAMPPVFKLEREWHGGHTGGLTD